jgi:hypothetical protein
LKSELRKADWKCRFCFQSGHLRAECPQQAAQREAERAYFRAPPAMTLDDPGPGGPSHSPMTEARGSLNTKKLGSRSPGGPLLAIAPATRRAAGAQCAVIHRVPTSSASSTSDHWQFSTLPRLAQTR